MTILIIGSKGFIGSHTISCLAQKPGIQCWGCDVVVDYASTNYFLVDSTNSDYGDIFNAVDFDVCINCSGAASVQGSLVNPYRDYILNTANVFKILETIRKESPSCKFLNISSAAVYGNPPMLPVSETQAPSPLSPYGLHKLHAEEICREFNQYYGLHTCSARVFSAYGTGLKKQIFWDVYQKTKGKDHITLAGTGNETRDFIFIDDLAEAILLIVRSAPFNGESINVGNGQGISVNEAVTTLIRQIPWQGPVNYDGVQRKGDPLYWNADITTLNGLGYQPRFSLEQGLARYIKWLQQNE